LGFKNIEWLVSYYPKWTLVISFECIEGIFQFGMETILGSPDSRKFQATVEIISIPKFLLTWKISKLSSSLMVRYEQRGCYFLITCGFLSLEGKYYSSQSEFEVVFSLNTCLFSLAMTLAVE
jgi:hypothetical protein